MGDGNATTAGRLPAQHGLLARGEAPASRERDREDAPAAIGAGSSGVAQGRPTGPPAAGPGRQDESQDEPPAADEPEVEPVGPRLRAAREAAGLTLEQVSARTRIRVPVLRELEDDRLGTAGTAVYTRGHLRAIAAAVGIDPVPLVRALDERVGARAPSTLAVAPVSVPVQPGGLNVPRAAPPERSQPRWLSACLAVMAVFVVLLAVGVFGDDGAERSDALESRAGTVAEVTPSPEPARSAPAAPVARAELVLRASGSSWLSVRNRGGYPVFEGTVQAGWTQRFADPRSLTVRVGNAGAVQGSCAGAPNGALAADPSASGTAVTLRCVPRGWQQP